MEEEEVYASPFFGPAKFAMVRISLSGGGFSFLLSVMHGRRYHVSGGLVGLSPLPIIPIDLDVLTKITTRVRTPMRGRPIVISND